MSATVTMPSALRSPTHPPQRPRTSSPSGQPLPLESARNAWVDKSVALAAAQFMLAIKAAGFDSCPMEGLDPEKVRALLGLPVEATVTMVISVGEGTPEGLYGPRLRFPLIDHLHEH